MLPAQTQPAVVAPGTPALLAATDTGLSSSDDITNSDNSSIVNELKFSVAGVIAGAVVTIYADGTAIGSATAAGMTMIVSTNGTKKLADGNHLITARQTSGGMQSGDSPALVVTIKTVALAPAPPVLASASDSGISNSDGITNIIGPTVDITAHEAGTISLQISGAGVVTKQITGPGVVQIPAIVPVGLQSTATLSTGYTGSGNSSTVAADFNGDGKQDLVSLGSGAALLFLGNGNGTFASPVTLPTYSGLGGLSTADFNGDGKPDLLFETQGIVGYSGFQILLNNGNGTFTALSAVSTPIYAQVLAADMNGDGKADIVFQQSYGITQLNVWLNNGNGGFPGNTYNVTVGSSINAFAVGDVNGDGKNDVVAVYGNSTEYMSVIVNKGNGTYGTPITTALSVSGSDRIALADFNGDGEADVMIGSSSVFDQVFISKGDGTFQTPFSCNTNGNALSLSTGDFNHDGKADALVQVDSGPSSTIYVLYGNGDGTLQPAVKYSLNGSPGLVAFADFNGDYQRDFALPQSGISNNITVLLATEVNLGAGTYPLTAWETDLAGNISATTASYTLTIDVSPPSASNFVGPANTTPANSALGFSVQNTDNYQVSVVSLTSNNFLVMGPNGYSMFASYVSTTPNMNSASTVSTYLTIPPTAGWTPAYNGTYRVLLQSGQVTDVAGNSMPATTVGFFTISISTAPAQPQLLAATDSGLSSSDGITNFNNATSGKSLKFSVGNTVPQATVTLYADGAAIGSSVANGSTTVVTTNGLMALADGVHSITARQAISGESPSLDSTPVFVTVDTSSPTVQLSAVVTGTMPVNSVALTFSEAIYGLVLGSLQLTRNGALISLTSSQTLNTTDQITWVLGGLSSLTANFGRYQLTLPAYLSITDLAGNALANSPATTWALSPDLGVSISDGGVAPARGQSLVYAVNYTLAAGAGNATGVVLTEAVPANSSFNAGLSDPRWSRGSGSTYTLSLGTLAAGASGSVPFAVAVNSSLPPQVVSLSNTAWIADDGADGADSNPANNTATITTGITFLSLASTQVGDGTSQRSTLRGASIQFSEAVNVSATSFTLYYESVADNQAFGNGVVTSRTFTALSNTADVSFASPDGGVTWVLSPVVGGAVDRTNGGGDANGNAIFADGVYKLVLHGSAITDVATGTRNFNFGSDQTVSFADGSGVMANDFAALFGDVDGNGTVTNSDLRALKRAFGANGGVYNPALDFGGDETVISNYDLAQFKKRFLVQLVY